MSAVVERLARPLGGWLGTDALGQPSLHGPALASAALSALALRATWLLLPESLLLCVAGAALGNVLGLALLHAVNGIESVGFGWIPLRLAPSLVGASFVLTALIALLALAWPAAVVWRMQPLAALRHD